jgi:N-methylhydantoinase B/oxoprolinase/acetone carboxylase alpha subunit
MTLPEGTTFRVNGPGGGGYGNPKKRNAEALKNDIAEGYVSEKAAKKFYR